MSKWRSRAACIKSVSSIKQSIEDSNKNRQEHILFLISSYQLGGCFNQP
ncbi:unnamed protein product [Musa acuminata subsp. burmannicoides]